MHRFIIQLPISKKNIITITGTSGAGASSVTSRLADALDYRKFSAGGLFRNVALRYDMTVEELNEYSVSHRLIDQEIDALLRRLGEGNQIVLDSRLGFHWIHNSFKVYLTVDRDVAAHRIYEDTINGRRTGEKATTLIEAATSVQNQSESTRKRYYESYGLDICNTNPFDLVVDTEKMTLDEVVTTIRLRYKEWLRQ